MPTTARHVASRTLRPAREHPGRDEVPEHAAGPARAGNTGPGAGRVQRQAGSGRRRAMAGCRAATARPGATCAEIQKLVENTDAEFCCCCGGARCRKRPSARARGARARRPSRCAATVTVTVRRQVTYRSASRLNARQGRAGHAGAKPPGTSAGTLSRNGEVRISRRWRVGGGAPEASSRHAMLHFVKSGSTRRVRRGGPAMEKWW